MKTFLSTQFSRPTLRFNLYIFRHSWHKHVKCRCFLHVSTLTPINIKLLLRSATLRLLVRTKTFSCNGTSPFRHCFSFHTQQMPNMMTMIVFHFVINHKSTLCVCEMNVVNNYCAPSVCVHNVCVRPLLLRLL